MRQLIAARALTGIGAGGIITVVSILLSDIVTLEERGLWQSYVNMVFACGAGLGAPLGGVLTDAVGWRWAFILQAPLCAFAILMVFVLLPGRLLPRSPYQTADNAKTTKLAQVDFLGATTLIVFLVTLLVFLDRISSTGVGWKPFIWLFASAVSLGAFLFIEQKVTSNPLTPLRLLFGKDFLGAYLALAFGNVAWYGVLFYVPLLYQAVSHYSPSLAGTLLLPGISSGVIGGLVGGAILKRRKGTGFRSLALGSYPLVTAACIGVATGASLFTQAGPSMATVIVVMSISLFIGGLGNGGGMTATLVVVVAVATPEDQAVATACVYLYRQLGATVGLALISTVFRRALGQNLVRQLGAGADVDEIVRGVSESLDYLQHLPAETRKVVENAYGNACQAALLVCMGLATCAIAHSCFIKERRRQ